jgi:hypothetical protein
MNLEQLQRAFFDMTRVPLTPSEKMSAKAPDGRSTRDVAESIIKPNDRLTASERLEIYNRQYWFRLLSSLSDDFPGLRTIVGERQFEKISIAYLRECGSQSFTLRNLGSQLQAWLMNHLEFVAKAERIAVDMVRLEWADIEAYDRAHLPPLKAESLSRLGEDPVFHLQPHMQLLDLAYPVDELLLSIRRKEKQVVDIASNAVMERTRRSRMKRSLLPKAEKVHLVVYRLEDSVYFKRLAPEAFALLRALGAGKPLSEAIEASVSWSNQPVERVSEKLHDWFANWSELGWFAQKTVKATKL